MNKAEKAADEKRRGTEVAEDIAWRWKTKEDQIKAAACITSHFDLSPERERAMFDGLGLKWARTSMGAHMIVAKEWPDRIIYVSTDKGDEFYAWDNGKRGARLKVDE